MEFKNHETGKWEALYPQLKWAKQYSKYRTATGSQRNRTCLGLDAAVRWNMKNNRDLNKVCVLCEGPLDAARLGAPAIAMLGKTISHEQAKLILNNFDKVAYVADKDEAGERGRDSFLQRFASQIPVKLVDLPDGFKDAGDLSEKQALGVMVREVYTWK
jgi:DNA primase